MTGPDRPADAVRNVVFDWSGTLCDDHGSTWELTNRVLRHFGGRECDLDTYRREFRIPVAGFFAARCPGAALDEIDERFFALYREEAPRLPLFPGVVDTVRALARDRRLAVLSTLPEEPIRAALEAHGLLACFAAVEGRARDKRLRLPGLLARLGGAPGETLFVGDMPHDVEAGRLAGARTAAATWGYAPVEDLRAARPDHLLAAIEDVPALLAPRSDARPIATSGGLAFRGQRALFVRTPKWRGLWGTPGGKIDRGETMAAAFVRELREETGLEVDRVRLALVQDCIDHPEFHLPRHFILVNFVGRAGPGEVRLNEEAVEHRWATLDEALALPLNEPTRILVEHVRAHPELRPE